MVAQAVNPFCQPRQRKWVLEKQKAPTGSARGRREGGQQGQDGTSTHEASKPRRAHCPTGHIDYKGRESRTNTSELYPAQSHKADKINTSRLATESRATVGGAWEKRRRGVLSTLPVLRGILYWGTDVFWPGTGRRQPCSANRPGSTPPTSAGFVDGSPHHGEGSGTRARGGQSHDG